jgi:hypothetical protein
MCHWQFFLLAKYPLNDLIYRFFCKQRKNSNINFVYTVYIN